ncbi:MAG: class I SAM-dependent methyltransferase [Coriobacteriales bacterium]|jgi:SAM-dependent methyltransferase
MASERHDPEFLQNAAKPVGEDGRALISRMNGGHHEELSTWGLSLVHPNGADRIIDLGCGGGANLVRLADAAPEAHVTGLDYSQVSIDVSRETCANLIQAGRCDLVLGDVGHLPFEDASFDFASAFETVYFWPDVQRAFAEANRVLAPGGRFMICNEADGTHEGDYQNVGVIKGMRVYKPEEIVGMLEQAGFSRVEVFRREERSWIVFEAFA